MNTCDKENMAAISLPFNEIPPLPPSKLNSTPKKLTPKKTFPARPPLAQIHDKPSSIHNNKPVQALIPSPFKKGTAEDHNKNSNNVPSSPNNCSKDEISFSPLPLLKQSHRQSFDPQYFMKDDSSTKIEKKSKKSLTKRVSFGGEHVMVIKPFLPKNIPPKPSETNHEEVSQADLPLPDIDPLPSQDLGAKNVYDDCADDTITIPSLDQVLKSDFISSSSSNPQVITAAALDIDAFDHYQGEDDTVTQVGVFMDEDITRGIKRTRASETVNDETETRNLCYFVGSKQQFVTSEADLNDDDFSPQDHGLNINQHSRSYRNASNRRDSILSEGDITQQIPNLRTLLEEDEEQTLHARRNPEIEPTETFSDFSPTTSANKWSNTVKITRCRRDSHRIEEGTPNPSQNSNGKGLDDSDSFDRMYGTIFGNDATEDELTFSRGDGFTMQDITKKLPSMQQLIEEDEETKWGTKMDDTASKSLGSKGNITVSIPTLAQLIEDDRTKTQVLDHRTRETENQEDFTVEEQNLPREVEKSPAKEIQGQEEVGANNVKEKQSANAPDSGVKNRKESLMRNLRRLSHMPAYDAEKRKSIIQSIENAGSLRKKSRLSVTGADATPCNNNLVSSGTAGGEKGQLLSELESLIPCNEQTALTEEPENAVIENDQIDHLGEFLSNVNIRFMDDLSGKVKDQSIGVHIEIDRAFLETPYGRLQSGCVSSVKLEHVEHNMEYLDSLTSSTRDKVKEMSSKFNRDTPGFVLDSLSTNNGLSRQDLSTLQRKCRRLKNYSRMLAKREWYLWRKEREDEIIKKYEQMSGYLDTDKNSLLSINETLSRVSLSAEKQLEELHQVAPEQPYVEEDDFLAFRGKYVEKCKSISRDEKKLEELRERKRLLLSKKKEAETKIQELMGSKKSLEMFTSSLKQVETLVQQTSESVRLVETLSGIELGRIENENEINLRIKDSSIGVKIEISCSSSKQKNIVKRVQVVDVPDHGEEGKRTNDQLETSRASSTLLTKENLGEVFKDYVIRTLSNVDSLPRLRVKLSQITECLQQTVKLISDSRKITQYRTVFRSCSQVMSDANDESLRFAMESELWSVDHRILSQVISNITIQPSRKPCESVSIEFQEAKNVIGAMQFEDTISLINATTCISDFYDIFRRKLQ